MCVRVHIRGYDWQHDPRSPVLVEGITQQDQVGVPWNMTLEPSIARGHDSEREGT